jgi:hypothetical protein
MEEKNYKLEWSDSRSPETWYPIFWPTLNNWPMRIDSFPHHETAIRYEDEILILPCGENSEESIKKNFDMVGEFILNVERKKKLEAI